MAKVRANTRVKVTGLSEALAGTLTEYGAEVLEWVDAAGFNASTKLKEITKATAPIGYRKKFRRSIEIAEVYKSRGKFAGTTYVWFVKPPEHRLTHLLVYGHATRNGGRTKGNSFLHDALDKVRPEFERDIEEAIRVGKRYK
jgi:hypothetical protein